MGDWAAHDSFFNNFTIIWRVLLETQKFPEAESVWEFALTTAQTWEEAATGRRLHKGTPYYFWGMTVILRGDLIRGFLLMHQALKEDELSHGRPLPDTPATAFVTIDYTKQDQAFRNEVERIANFLDQLLTKYRQDLGRALTLKDFRKRLLSQSKLMDAVFSLVFVLAQSRALTQGVKPGLRRNAFGALVETDLLFNICLIVETVLRDKNLSGRSFIDHAVHLCSRAGLSLDIPRLREVNAAANQDVEATLRNLLGSTWKFTDGSILSPGEVDVAVTYVLRNVGAHKVESLTVIQENFEEALQRVFNTLFLVVEVLY